MAAMVQLIGAAFGWQPSAFYSHQNGIRPFYMVARPGFSGGWGQWLDLFSPLNWNYPIYYAPEDIAAVTTAADWAVVYGDLARSVDAASKRLGVPAA
jgi:hypothetical protein